MSTQIIREYYKLAKPGIVYGNIFTTAASYLFALAFFRRYFSLAQVPAMVFVFFAALIGLGFVIASACVFNNYLDRNIDRKMARTSTRALVTGTISVQNALIYGSVLGMFGLAILFLCVNVLSVIVAFIGFIFYVGIYGYAKRKSHWGAVVGSIPGAIPIVLGYIAITNQIDPAAIILFFVMVFWQMPHFYAISMYRLDEYKEAGIPVLPAIKGIKATKIHILLYIIAFVLAMSALFFFGYEGYVYLVAVLAFGLAWLWRGVLGFKASNTSEDASGKWARGLFLFSLIVLVLFCVSVAAGPLLP